jgi:hypothetical protein
MKLYTPNKVLLSHLTITLDSILFSQHVQESNEDRQQFYIVNYDNISVFILRTI